MAVLNNILPLIERIFKLVELLNNEVVTLAPAKFPVPTSILLSFVVILSVEESLNFSILFILKKIFCPIVSIVKLPLFVNVLALIAPVPTSTLAVGINDPIPTKPVELIITLFPVLLPNVTFPVVE